MLTRDHPFYHSYEKYVARVEEHIHAVRDACHLVGRITLVQMAEHDLSKYSEEEFIPYAQYFFPDPKDTIADEIMKKGRTRAFQIGWLHHVHHNPHHWQHWINGNTILPMPNQFAREMVADWMGASQVYSGKGDMSEWLGKNWPTLILHPDTRTYVEDILIDLGYEAIVSKPLPEDVLSGYRSL